MRVTHISFQSSKRERTRMHFRRASTEQRRWATAVTAQIRWHRRIYISTPRPLCSPIAISVSLQRCHMRESNSVERHRASSPRNPSTRVFITGGVSTNIEASQLTQSAALHALRDTLPQHAQYGHSTAPTTMPACVQHCQLERQPGTHCE